MITFVCEKCGSDEVQAMAWVSLNDLTDIDFSLSEDGDDEHYWCNKCEDHNKAIQLSEYAERLACGELGYDYDYWVSVKPETSTIEMYNEINLWIKNNYDSKDT